MRNLFKEFLALIPDPAVQSVSANVATVVLPGGGLLKARGGSPELVGRNVFVRDGVIEGLAPDLPTEIIEV
ncbi:MAG: hypothetical protein Q7K57_35155 [Burkholderiaceae bacterium]|nr:hypothetical protein [Burkholderiaceae bacterium]